MSMRPRKINQKRAFQFVEEQLEEAILSGRIKPGDKFPSERDLVADLATSRRSLREAMRVLEQKGLIEIRLGMKGGSFVREPTTDSVSESLALLIRRKKIPVNELTEFRVDLEGTVARRAAERADDRDIEGLKRIILKAESVLSDPDADFQSFHKVDLEFHEALATAARNQLYESVLKIVHENMSRYFEKHLDFHSKLFREHYREMIEMVQAIETRDGDRAYSIANRHVRKFFQYVEAECP